MAKQDKVKEAYCMNDFIKINKVEKTFNTEKGDTFKALDKIDLVIKENEFICILGPSGCGKSTLLRIISGLDNSSSGEILFKGDVHTKACKEIGMVFQNYSLMPWLNVLDNISLGLNFAKMPKKQRQKLALEYLDMIGMKDFAKSMPHELSGGMQQRVAIARSLANNPDVLLMDEPFGALDAYTRIVLQKELLRIWEHHKKTIIFVTHSVDEAVFLADRIILMDTKPGRIKKEIYVDIDRIRDRANPEYAKLTAELLNELEQMNV